MLLITPVLLLNAGLAYSCCIFLVAAMSAFFCLTLTVRLLTTISWFVTGFQLMGLNFIVARLRLRATPIASNSIVGAPQKAFLL